MAFVFIGSGHANLDVLQLEDLTDAPVYADKAFAPVRGCRVEDTVLKADE